MFRSSRPARRLRWRLPALFAAAALSFALAACTAAGSATASASAAAANTSAHPLHIIGVDGEALAAGTVRGWDADVLASPQASDTTFSHAFAIPATTQTVVAFLSARGHETDTGAWNATGWIGLTPGGILLPNLKLGGLTSAGSGDPSGTVAVAHRGGDYSLGIAFLDATGRVIEADFTAITVTGNSNPENATWTWSVPAS